MWEDMSTGEMLHQGCRSRLVCWSGDERAVNRSLVAGGEPPIYCFLQASYARRLHVHVTRLCDADHGHLSSLLPAPQSYQCNEVPVRAFELISVSRFILFKGFQRVVILRSYGRSAGPWPI